MEVYDFIDFLFQLRNQPIQSEFFIIDINLVLERELSGYRVINRLLAPITSEVEVLEIEKALNSIGNNKKYKGANIHLNEALIKLSDRENPDYRNSIKESISAIESISKDIANNKKADLAMAMKELKRVINIHPALEQGFVKIYGYTSDGDGIRHALTDEPNLGQEDALFMLVASSAFINYLIAKAEKAGKD
ncbi:AbiJ-NTD4 domain-containing protein [Puia sp.]|uniref:AbiJ-NTD4 domain-containing protein n=1 Tax=Puia sp. TaxID=2045100 RepID=UPI0039C9697D